MDLDELKKEWQARDDALTEQLRVNNQLMRASFLNQQESTLRGTSKLGWFYWLTFVTVVLALGSFIAAHVGEPKFLIPALFIQIWVIVMNVFEVVLDQAIKQLDFSAPVLRLQGQLEKIRQQRLRLFKWGFLTGQIVWWIPLVIVLFEGLFNVDLYEVNDFMPRIMLLNVVGGVAAIPILLGASDFIAHRFGHVHALKRLLASLTGQDIQESLRFLNRLQEFD